MRLDTCRIRRWLVGLLSAVCVAISCTGCDHGSGSGSGGLTPAPVKLDVGLTMTTRQDPGFLVIEYTLTNRERMPVTAFTGVPKRDAAEQPAVDPDGVYVTVRGDGVVEIAKRVFAPPEGVHPYAYFVVLGAVVQPGERFSETVRVPLPFKARRPYDSNAKLPKNMTKAVFCVGIVADGAVQPQLEQQSPSQQQFQSPWRSGGLPSLASRFAHSEYVANAQQLVCGKPFTIA